MLPIDISLNICSEHKKRLKNKIQGSISIPHIMQEGCEIARCNEQATTYVTIRIQDGIFDEEVDNVRL